VILVPALLSPMLSVGAATPSLTVGGVAVPGGELSVIGEGLPPREWVQVQWDGSPSGMPTVRTSSGSTLTTTITVPNAALPGDHILRVVSSQRGTKRGQQSGTQALTADVGLALDEVVTADGTSRPSPFP
jgi:hypothetical protein